MKIQRIGLAVLLGLTFCVVPVRSEPQVRPPAGPQTAIPQVGDLLVGSFLGELHSIVGEIKKSIQELGDGLIDHAGIEAEDLLRSAERKFERQSRLAFSLLDETAQKNLLDLKTSLETTRDKVQRDIRGAMAALAAAASRLPFADKSAMVLWQDPYFLLPGARAPQLKLIGYFPKTPSVRITKRDGSTLSIRGEGTKIEQSFTIPQDAYDSMVANTSVGAKGTAEVTLPYTIFRVVPRSQKHHAQLQRTSHVTRIGVILEPQLGSSAHKEGVPTRFEIFAPTVDSPRDFTLQSGLQWTVQYEVDGVNRLYKESGPISLPQIEVIADRQRLTVITKSAVASTGSNECLFTDFIVRAKTCNASCEVIDPAEFICGAVSARHKVLDIVLTASVRRELATPDGPKSARQLLRTTVCIRERSESSTESCYPDPPDSSSDKQVGLSDPVSIRISARHTVRGVLDRPVIFIRTAGCGSDDCAQTLDSAQLRVTAQ